MGDYYAYDVPYAIKEELRSQYKHKFEKFNYYFNLLYSVYTFPNIFLPFINGYLTNKIGDQRMLTILGVLVFLGSCIITIGSKIRVFELLVFGRFIYGLGGDSITAIQWAMVMEYFHSEKEIGFAIMMVYIFTTFGSMANLFISPIIAKNWNTDAVFFFTSIICMFGLIARYFLYKIDLNYHNNNLINDSDNKNKKIKDDNKIDKVNAVSESQINNQNNEKSQANIENIQIENIQYRKSLDLGKRYWYNNIYSLFLVISINGFFYISSNYFMSKWFSQMKSIEAEKESTRINFIGTLLYLVFVPILGVLADKYGLHTEMGVAAPIFITISYLLYIFVFPYLPTIINSFGGSLNYTSIWSNISFCVESKNMNMAMGIIYSLQNIALLFTPYITLLIKDISNSYEAAILFLILMNICGFIFSVLYYYENQTFILVLKTIEVNQQIKLKEISDQEDLNDQEDNDLKINYRKDYKL